MHCPKCKSPRRDMHPVNEAGQVVCCDHDYHRFDHKWWTETLRSRQLNPNTSNRWTELHALSSDHKDACLTSEFCGCFYCESKFDPKEIKEWIDRGQTALCPRCGIDSVLPGKLVEWRGDVDILKVMHSIWFDTEVANEA